MLRCSNCDHFNLADATVCERCGRPLVDESPSAQVAADGESLEAQVLAIAGTTGKIPAIKYYREQTGAGLKDAKQAVEQLLAQHNVKAAGSSCSVLFVALLLSGLAFGAFAAIAILR